MNRTGLDKPAKNYRQSKRRQPRMAKGELELAEPG